jgi:GNAT superfamily N-acetyltransferase
VAAADVTATGPAKASLSSRQPCKPAAMAVIRPSTPQDGPDLQRIELLAGEQFRDVGMPEIAGDQPAPAEVLATYAEAGRSWAALDGAGEPCGYVLVDVVDGNAHIEQISVLPDHQGRGIGRALIDRVRAWAAERRMAAVTLTTFRDVPWNAPLYRHLGFRDLSEDELGPGLEAVRDKETAHGLDPATRVCMRVDLAAPTG